MGLETNTLNRLRDFKRTSKTSFVNFSANLNNHRFLWTIQIYCGFVRAQIVLNVNNKIHITGYGPDKEYT